MIAFSRLHATAARYVTNCGTTVMWEGRNQYLYQNKHIRELNTKCSSAFAFTTQLLHIIHNTLLYYSQSFLSWIILSTCHTYANDKILAITRNRAVTPRIAAQLMRGGNQYLYQNKRAYEIKYEMLFYFCFRYPSFYISYIIHYCIIHNHFYPE